ncbi:hypothetical protein ABZZ36_05815 [Actinacidiphila glaucinigra]|uniref:hypothetical protein n=1 Tax=Actinacidiphila glaucinigra TaxID=235986 RepID=UPI00339F10C3
MTVDHRTLFGALLADDDFTARLKDRGLSLYFVPPEPGAAVFVSSDGVVAGEPPFPPTLRFEMGQDTAHEIWSGRLPLMNAVVERRLAIKGPVGRVRQLTDLLPAVCATYAELSARPRS